MSKDDESESEMDFEEALPDENKSSVLNLLGQITRLLSENTEMISKLGSLDSVFFKQLIQRSDRARERKHKERQTKNKGFFAIILVLIIIVALFTYLGIISGQTLTLFIGSILGYIAKLHSDNIENKK